MCGIFGYVAKAGGPNINRLKRIAIQTERRGTHAFGLAWLDADGRIHSYKRPGPATANLGDLDACRDAEVVIGHCRWATHGEPEDNRNNHPHAAGSGLIVHNGVVINYESLLRQYNLAAKTECDSEVIGLIMAKLPGSIGERAAKAVGATIGRLAMLGIWRNPTRLLMVRRGNPLHFGESKRGFYFASLPEDLPGDVKMLRDNYASIATCRANSLKFDSFKL